MRRSEEADPHHPRRQPGAQSGAKRAADPAGARQTSRGRLSSTPRFARAPAHVVASQLESGIDIGGDGEQARAGYSTYPALRMSGFGR